MDTSIVREVVGSKYIMVMIERACGIVIGQTDRCGISGEHVNSMLAELDREPRSQKYLRAAEVFRCRHDEEGERVALICAAVALRDEVAASMAAPVLEVAEC